MNGRTIPPAEAEKLLAPLGRFPHIAIAVSGGPDSLALLYLAARWRRERGGEPGITALTVDHQLRSDSRLEAEMVAARAAAFGVKHAILTWSHAERADRALQARAREARYSLMASYCHAHDIPALATAHQLDDQAETLLMRLKRGSGLDGLAAIPEESFFAGIVLLRPLLDVPKDRLVATLREAGIDFASDPSNLDPRFERTTIRSDREAVDKLGFSAEAIARAARRLRRARVALEEASARFLTEHAKIGEAGYALIDRGALLSAPEEIALRSLARLLASVGGKPEPVRLSKIEALLAGLSEAPQKTHTLGGCRIEPVGDDFGVFREIRGEGLPELSLRPGERALWDNRFSVTLGRKAAGPIVVRALGEAEAASERASSSPQLDALPRRARLALPVGFSGEEILLPQVEPSSAKDGTLAGRLEEGLHARFVNRISSDSVPEFGRFVR
jgi:tRNA(Ile)-lysidine synthase